MAALKGKKTVGAPFPNALEVVKVVYDFALDGAMASPLDVLEAADDIVIVGFFGKVITTCTSGGSATLAVGVSGGDIDVLMGDTPVASLVAGYFIVPPQVLTEGTPNTMSPQLPIKLADGGKIVCDTTTASFLTGKIEWTFIIARF